MAAAALASITLTFAQGSDTGTTANRYEMAERFAG